MWGYRVTIIIDQFQINEILLTIRQMSKIKMIQQIVYLTQELILLVILIKNYCNFILAYSINKFITNEKLKTQQDIDIDIIKNKQIIFNTLNPIYIFQKYQRSIIIYKTLLQINKIKMLPSMRYETKKLTQLYHMKKSYRQHKRSISKIMNKQLKSSVDRTKQLNELRDRMHSAFNYTQYVRDKDITKNNYILYRKCTDDRKSNISIRVEDKKSQSLQNLFGLTAGTGENRASSTQNVNRSEYLLKNHRNSPINKMTNFQRSRQNLRLAVKISRPCPVINTKKLQQIHEKAKQHRQRIMKYESISLKSSKYLDKKLSSNSFRSQSISNRSNKSKSKQNQKNPESKSQRYNFNLKNNSKKSPSEGVKKMNRTFIFRNKHNDHLYGFSLTDYKQKV